MRIQHAVLPNLKDITFIQNMSYLDYFVIFKPKDIVSGDFYWVTIVNDWLIVTVADCTGHGVPGAFMSMLGVSFLNELVSLQANLNGGDFLHGNGVHHPE
ncbi:MAG: hypothetical protein HY738_19795 [Bacteroidia bacterium]|nr:hypothetical protein [Bacteroidia bacterium]